MSTQPSRPQLSSAALRLFSPSIRRRLIADAEFVKSLGVVVDSTVTLSDGVAVKRSLLLDAVRSVFVSDDKAGFVQNVAGKEMSITLAGDPEFRITCTSESKSFVLPGIFNALASSSEVRLAMLRDLQKEAYLSKKTVSFWKDRLAAAEATDEELAKLNQDLQETPQYCIARIQNSFELGKINVQVLVPNSRAYYERLIGPVSAKNIVDHAKGAHRDHCRDLLEWHPRDGLLQALLLSSHRHTVCAIGEIFERSQSEDLQNEIHQSGDWISKLGISELGIEFTSDAHNHEKALLSTLSDLISTAPNDEANRFQLLSSLFGLVDGELSRLKLFAGEAPFVRRLAALAQASLIERGAIAAEVDLRELNSWVSSVQGADHYVQTLLDLRVEPRWLPDFGSATQLRAEFFGRLFRIAKDCESRLPSGVNALLLQSNESEFGQVARSMTAYWPGPLEGNASPPGQLPDEVSTEILGKLTQIPAEAAAYTSLINSSLLFPLPSDLVVRASSAIRATNFRLPFEERAELIGTIVGLAHVSAVQRSSALVESLRGVMRRYGGEANGAIPLATVVEVGVICAASVEDLRDWAALLGNWLTELAFGLKEKEDAEHLSAVIKTLLRIEPALWASLGRAEGALRAYLAG